MAREVVHKKVKVGTLILINQSEEIGIVLGAYWNKRAYEITEHAFKYKVYVRGKEVSASREGFTIIGEF